MGRFREVKTEGGGEVEGWVGEEERDRQTEERDNGEI